jgi:tRNA(fMet)-specific endonuclease VapC
MSVLVDTNVCIRFLNGRSESIRARFRTTPPEQIYLCSVVVGELLFGAAKSQHPDKTLARQLQFISRFVSFPFDDLAARSYAKIRAELERDGNLIGANDLMIAAIAVSRGITLVTNNVREFGRVGDLALENWE